MRRSAIAFFVLMLISGGLSMTAYASDCFKDTAADRAGDWVAALGKKGLEKDQLLARRKADRVLLCAQKQAQKTAAEVQKAGNDMKKKLGL